MVGLNDLQFLHSFIISRTSVHYPHSQARCFALLSMKVKKTVI